MSMSAHEGLDLYEAGSVRPAPAVDARTHVDPRDLDPWGAVAQCLHHNARYVIVMGAILGCVIAAA